MFVLSFQSFYLSFLILVISASFGSFLAYWFTVIIFICSFEELIIFCEFVLGSCKSFPAVYQNIMICFSFLGLKVCFIVLLFRIFRTFMITILLTFTFTQIGYLWVCLHFLFTACLHLFKFFWVSKLYFLTWFRFRQVFLCVLWMLG